MQVDEDESSLLPKTLNIAPKIAKSKKVDVDITNTLDGNTKQNKMRKMQFKKDKKKRTRDEKKAIELSNLMDQAIVTVKK